LTLRAYSAITEMSLAPHGINASATRKVLIRMSESVRVEGYLHPRKRCECGQMVADIKSSLHRTGVRHRRYKTMVRLLSSNCITYSEIAERLGVSRERIRQLAGSVTGKTTRERRDSCHVSRAFQRWRAHPNTQFLFQQGLEVRPFMLKYPSRVYALPSNKIFRVGDKKILVKRMYKSEILPGRAVRVTPMRKSDLGKVDFVVSPSPFGAFVFPANDHPPRGTMFVVEPKQKPGGNRNRHDWPKYREAWHLISTSPAAPSAPKVPLSEGLPN
jgi:hypothetical protein